MSEFKTKAYFWFFFNCTISRVWSGTDVSSDISSCVRILDLNQPLFPRGRALSGLSLGHNWSPDHATVVLVVHLVVPSGRLDIGVAGSGWGEQRHPSRILLRRKKIHDDINKVKCN